MEGPRGTKKHGVKSPHPTVNSRRYANHRLPLTPPNSMRLAEGTVSRPSYQQMSGERRVRLGTRDKGPHSLDGLRPVSHNS
ncbi:unnamed protein product [Sphagnum balticum]